MPTRLSPMIFLVALALSLPAASAREIEHESPTSSPAPILSLTDGYAADMLDACVDPMQIPEALVTYGAAAAALFGFTAPDPCCACGVPDKGCIAIAKPCCCRASISTSGVITCSCQGGKGCGASSTGGE